MNALKNLAISETGFIFDPGSGNTFVVNETGLLILKALQTEKSDDQIFKKIFYEYEIDNEQLMRDFSSFKIQMKELGLQL